MFEDFHNFFNFLIIQFFFTHFANFYPPFLGAGIKLKKISSDKRYARVEMPLRFYNQNFLQAHYGGSLYSMTDPWLMYMLIQNLGNDFIVWDKAASIRFKKPGRKKVFAEFKITEEDLTEIKNNLIVSKKFEKNFQISIFDMDGLLVAEVDKLIYIRKKD